MKHPIVLLSLTWLLGTYLILLGDSRQFLFVFLLFIACLTMLYLKRIVTLGQIGLYFLCFLLSVAYNTVHESARVTVLPAEIASVEQDYIGRLVTVPEMDGDLVQFTFQLLPWKEKVRVRLKLHEQAEQNIVKDWRRGDHFVIFGRMEQPSKATNFGAFDYREYLRKQRIFWQLEVDGLDAVRKEEVISRTVLGSLYRGLSGIDQLQSWLSKKIDRIYPQDQTGWMQGILIGNKEGIDPERYDRFARIGVSHLLAISGLHVGIVTTVLVWLLRVAGCNRDWIFCIMCAVIPFYILLTGAAPSVVRAGFMALIGFYAWKKGWLKHSLAIWSLVLWAMLIIRPDYLHEVGFQLSFAVTAGLIIGVPAMNHVLHKLPHWLRNTFSVTITAELVSFPLSVYYFNQYSILSWLANLFLVPLVSLIVLPGGLVTLLAAVVSEKAASFISYPIRWMNTLVFKVAEWIDQIDPFHLFWPTPSPIWLLFYYSLMLLLFHYSMRRRSENNQNDGSIPLPFTPVVNKRSKAGFALCLLGLAAIILYGYQPNAWLIPVRGSVYFIDVGQGDAALIRTPTGKHLLVDGGGRMSFYKEEEQWKQRQDPFDVGKDVLVPLLKQRGVHQLDYILLSHADADHVGGLVEVVRRVPVKRIMINGTVKKNPVMFAFIEAALKRDIPIYTASAGQKVEVDRYTCLDVLHPFESEGLYNEENQNERSLVFLLHLFDARILFAGDLEKEQEQALVAQLKQLENENASGKLERQTYPLILKAAHHGSNTSSSAQWLDYWKPEVTIISAGRNNLYGHPHQAVLQRLNQLGSQIYRTDTHGEIQLKITANQMAIRTKISTNKESVYSE